VWDLREDISFFHRSFDQMSVTFITVALNIAAEFKFNLIALHCAKVAAISGSDFSYVISIPSTL